MMRYALFITNRTPLPSHAKQMTADAGTEGNISSTYCKIWVYPDSCSVAGHLLLYLSTQLAYSIYNSIAPGQIKTTIGLSALQIIRGGHIIRVFPNWNRRSPTVPPPQKVATPSPASTNPKPETSMDLGLGSAGAGTISGVQKPHARTKISRA